MNRNNMAKIFKAFTRNDGNIVYNLSKSIYINSDGISVSFYTDYVVEDGDSWTLISQKSFDTIDLWWLICKFNQIVSPIDMPIPGTLLKIPTKSIVDQIIRGM